MTEVTWFFPAGPCLPLQCAGPLHTQSNFGFSQGDIHISFIHSVRHKKRMDSAAKLPGFKCQVYHFLSV